MKKKVTLLITCVGGSLSVNVLSELRRSKSFDYRLIGVNASGPVAAQSVLDGFFKVPLGDDGDYIPRLLDIIRTEKIDAVLPGSDEEAFALSFAIPEIESLGARAIVSPPDCLKRIGDKGATYRCMAEAGLKVPEHTVVNDARGLETALNAYGYPQNTVVFKPSKGRGGRGLHIFCGRDEPPQWLGRGKREKRVEPDSYKTIDLSSALSRETIVMPCLKVPAYDADVLHIGDGVYASIVRRRNNPAGIPFEGNRIVADASLQDYCRKVAAVLGLKGLHDIDLMSDGEGNPVVLEVNPRPSGSIAATLAAGFPMIDWAVSALLGMKPVICEPVQDIDVVSCPSAFAVPV